ncbi:unnamed protein product [Paramecium octaurelia]|uniref:Uncharacterized protein n=1 Tax=Paramecium octaurelia TaxID=43137 RepID=A0A8S1WIX3_PAROT|nr:unnamed protein product [Paramecium octaurelia]
MLQQTSQCSNCRAQISDTKERCEQFFEKMILNLMNKNFIKVLLVSFWKEIFQDISTHTKCPKKPIQFIDGGLD